MLLKKNNWEVKKLGEVCDIISGSTPKTNNPQYWDGDYYWVTPAELDGNKWISSTERTITDMGVKSAHLQLLPSGTVLLSSRAPIGKIAITTCPMYCNQGFKNLVCKNVILNEFVYWFLLFSTEYLKSLGTGATFKEISKKVVEQVDVPVPPLPEQSRIVEELDQLSNIIEKKRQQLSELDNLAQSIFYDMFGDPVTNEKGWEVKKLGEVCEPKSKIIRANKQYLSKDKIRYIDISSIDNSCNTITHTNVMNFGDAPSRAQQIVLIGDVLVSLVRPNLRNIALISYDYDDLVASTGFCVLRTIEIINSYYLLYCVLGENFTDYLMERTSGANYPAVREEDIKGYDLCIPPLSLQQLFAQKIEAIEKEKELIKQSIKETEELFNSRMDYYFG